MKSVLAHAALSASKAGVALAHPVDATEAITAAILVRVTDQLAAVSSSVRCAGAALLPGKIFKASAAAIMQDHAIAAASFGGELDVAVFPIVSVCAAETRSARKALNAAAGTVIVTHAVAAAVDLGVAKDVTPTADVALGT